MNRREFLGIGAAAAAMPLCASGKGRGVKFCVFADIHYAPGIFPHSTKEWLRRITDHALSEKCDFIIHLGDFTHRPAAAGDYIACYRTCGIPAYHVIGNHDDDGNTHEETLKAYGLESGHYFFDRGGFRFVVVDPNYILWADGRVEHHSGRNYFKNGKKGKISYVPKEQLSWLRKTLEGSPYPCVVCSHQSFERHFGSSCSNDEEVRAIFDDVNKRHPGRVMLVMNGHHHCDNLRLLEGILYFDVNSANYQWVGPAYAHNKYPEEYRKANAEAKHILGWDDPIHAIVTLSTDGRISIKGMKSRFSYGVTPASIGFKGDSCGRSTTPNIQSVEMSLMHC